MISSTIRLLAIALCVSGFSTFAQAQATRTWVSGVGDDVNPCSRTAPCKTFAGAISKTATGGEISVLDPGGYGALTITKAITVDGGTGAGWGSTLFASTNGFVINITTNLATDKVILRNLSLNGGVSTSLGVDGIRFLDGQQLTVENVRIFNFSGDGIEVNQAQASNVFLKNVRITHGAIGIRITSAALCSGSFDDVQIDAMSSHGVEGVSNARIVMTDVHTTRCGGAGVKTNAASVDFSVLDGVSSGNNFGYDAPGGVIRISNCGMFYNNTNLSGTVASGGNNKSAFNTTQNVPVANGMVVN